jgi:hypothetical protein
MYYMLQMHEKCNAIINIMKWNSMTRITFIILSTSPRCTKQHKRQILNALCVVSRGYYSVLPTFLWMLYLPVEKNARQSSSKKYKNFLYLITNVYKSA